MKETLTPEQKEIALKARRDYYRGRKADWYRRGLREMEAKDESEIENATEANG
jgi:hypothetical protein